MENSINSCVFIGMVIVSYILRHWTCDPLYLNVYEAYPYLRKYDYVNLWIWILECISYKISAGIKKTTVFIWEARRETGDASMKMSGRHNVQALTETIDFFWEMEIHFCLRKWPLGWRPLSKRGPQNLEYMDSKSWNQCVF